MVLGSRFGHVPDPACSAPLAPLSARSRPAASGSGRQSPNPAIGSSTGRHGATEYRVYHGGMAPDTYTLPRRPTPSARPEPAATGPAASAATTAARAPGASETATLAVADSAAPAPEAPPDLNQLGNRIAELSARIQAATYELLCDLREFDRHHGWEGFRSCAHWLNWRTGLDLGAAREKLRVAAALADLNHLSAAMACGRLSYSMVRALTRVATADNEARLIAVACCATAAQVERLVRGWRQADREAQPDAEQVRLERRTLSTRVDEDGMVVLRARLTPEVGAVVLRAVEAALEQVPAVTEDAAGGDEASIAQRRADALGLVAESALAGGLDPGSSGDRFQVTVHVEADGLCCREAAAAPRHVSAEIAPGSEAACAPAAALLDGVAEQVSMEHAEQLPATEATPDRDLAVAMPGPDAGQAVIEQAGGIHVGKEAARRVACDAGLVELRHGADGEVLDVGRRTRTVPTALRRALQSRDRNQCQFPGCESRHCDAHHVMHWADGGETQLFNLVSLCRFHHRAVHEEGFQVVADGAGGFLFLRPNGEPLPAVPPAPRWDGVGPPLAPTVERLAAAGISIGPHTATPEWYGESLNVAAALDVLWEPPVAAARGGAP